MMVACSSTSSMTCWVMRMLPAAGFTAEEPTLGPVKLAVLELFGKRYLPGSSLGVAELGRLSSRLSRRFSAEATVFTRDSVPDTLTRLGEEPSPRRDLPLPAEKCMPLASSACVYHWKRGKGGLVESNQ